MSGTIFLRQGDKLIPMHQAPFDSEDLLQALLAKYPDLLAGDQIDPEEPRRWLLISREVSVPDALGGAGRWSLDHLFVDQEAIPTLVEVKRASDTRIRREVAGQMLDYAANAVAFWPIAVLRASFEQNAAAMGIDPAQAVLDLVRADPTEKDAVDSFWTRLDTNLQAGRIRMVFVADQIPEELRRIVEFLNRQMGLAEVLAVEIPQFVGSELQTLVPRVYGFTAEARSRKKSSTSGSAAAPISESDFFTEVAAQAGPDVAGLARTLLDWSSAESVDGKVDWISTGFVPVLPGGPKGFFYPFMVDTKGQIRFYLQVLRFYRPFDSEVTRQDLIARLNAIPGVAVPTDATNGKPPIPLKALAEPSRFKQFLAVVKWVQDEVMKATAPAP